MEDTTYLKEIEGAVERILQEEGFELVDLEIEKQKELILRIFIDKTGGVTIDDCALVSDITGRALDRQNVIKTPFRLEVSSPGIERRLKKPADFERFKGSMINAKTTRPVEGCTEWSGQLASTDENGFVLDIEGKMIKVPYEILDKAHLVVDVKI